MSTQIPLPENLQTFARLGVLQIVCRLECPSPLFDFKFWISDLKFQTDGWIPLLPQVSIQNAIVDGFAEVVELDLVGGLEVGNGSGKTQHLIVGACG